MNFIHDYYIIESLTSSDINDGKIFHASLQAMGQFNPIYKNVVDLKELSDALHDFAKSAYKYLFISAHGDEENLYLVNEAVNSYDLLNLSIDLTERRVFMSSCRGGSYLFAKYFIKKGAYSVVGTPDDLNQAVAVAIWPTMVIVFDRLNKGHLNFSELNSTLIILAKIYEIRLVYYSFIRKQVKMKEYVYTHLGREPRTDYDI
jgi:hypothetical protein